MKKLLTVLCVVVSMTFFSGCCLFYDLVRNVNGFDVGYSARTNDAFLGSYSWDGKEESLNIEIPEEYKGAPITSLGGYFGRGVPTPFNIEVSRQAQQLLSPNALRWSGMDIRTAARLDNVVVEYYTFNVRLSKNIKELQLISLDRLTVSITEENQVEYYKVYVLKCNFTCDEDNKVFYAQDGKLFYKNSGKLVENIFYADFDYYKAVEDVRQSNS